MARTWVDGDEVPEAFTEAAADARFVKLDQEAGPQNPVGEFLLPRLGLGSATRPLRGKLDILGDTVTIADVTGDVSALTFNYSELYYNYAADGQYRQYDVYAFKTVAGTRIYSQNPFVIYGTDDNSGIGMYFQSYWWNTLPDAEGYRVIVTDPTMGAYSNYYFDTVYNYLSFGWNGTGYEDVSGQSITYGNDVVTKSVVTGEDYYIDANGDLVSTNKATFKEVVETIPTLLKLHQIPQQYVTGGKPAILDEPSFTYNLNGTLQRVDYPSGAYKNFSYNLDGTLNTINYNGVYTKTFVWLAGVLQSIGVS